MNHEQFIRKNIETKLTQLGFSFGIIQKASDEALRHYQRCSQASRKGKMFDDCYRIAKVWAEKLSHS